MSQPLQVFPVIDDGNSLLAPGPAELRAAPVPPGSTTVPAMFLTIRTSSATLTVVLDRDSGLQWAAIIRGEAEKLNSAGLIVPSAGQALRAAAQQG